MNASCWCSAATVVWGASIASTRRTSSCGGGVSLMLTGRKSYGAAPTPDDAMAFAAEYEGWQKEQPKV